MLLMRKIREVQLLSCISYVYYMNCTLLGKMLKFNLSTLDNKRKCFAKKRENILFVGKP